MKLTTRSRYGTRMLLDIAIFSVEHPVPTKDIARRQELPLKYLEQIIRSLRAAGFLTSTRGAYGGYRLAKPADEIRIGDIALALEDPDGCAGCERQNTCCHRVGECLARSIWQEASEAMYHKLNTYTLADLIEDAKLCPKNGVHLP